MKKYDFDRAKQIINALKKELLRAEMGLLENWYNTATNVWVRNGCAVELNENTRIAGASGSYTATPTLFLMFDNYEILIVDCYTETE